MTSITLKGITKRFGSTTAVDSVDLTINSGELFFLLGPSGCGKTTLLRMIAGFIEATEGHIMFGDTNMTTVPPNRRNTGMVFQSYALWPHMTVLDNVAFGLSVRKVLVDERRERAMAALQAVQMDPYAQRKPNELSGGQQQRVALARALVIKPTVLLLDEPLSNLDAKLRLEMRSEIRSICVDAEITTVYVTHDQKEALSMADRIAVLEFGKIVQVGAPRELYERPNCRFVAEFLGETNFLEATITGAEGEHVALDSPAGRMQSAAADANARGAVTCSIRPETLQIVTTPAAINGMTGRRVDTTYLGDHAQHLVELPDGTRLKILDMNPGAHQTLGNEVHLTVRPDQVVVLSK